MDQSGISDQAWMLRADGVSRRFGTTLALSDARLTLDRGEAVAIMGPSGSGKSTLLHVLAGVLAAEEGRVLMRPGPDTEAVDLTGMHDDDRSALRLRRFGFVFQQGLLLPELTAMENIVLPLLFQGVQRREAHRTAEEALRDLGLQGLGNRRIGQLSGGQASRVAIARAIVTDPSIVFADEPTGALDSLTAHDVLTVLLELGRAKNRALVIVTHDDRVASRCDRIVRLSDGRIERPV
ncbi:ABC transporter ATP-binding protein [uncultured Agrococcus sp.]|uniref:ABC transporter ATP-binding protein n=1 Tax=uncultured Agrococcus sp. TaxID=382258 RepID=UPI0025D3922B|nr:ABC transporter ATP-binding protein [uncultured Agrococcus sp.]